jgi:hypothetical protein
MLATMGAARRVVNVFEDVLFRARNKPSMRVSL